jgi:hypothetical protein
MVNFTPPAYVARVEEFLLRAEWETQWAPQLEHLLEKCYKGVDKSLARPGRKQATVTEDCDFHIFHL